ncbi:DUF4386 domain-containing protein [Runella aurantiaca]|uniref:DUF4386 domain-containing protein n=2 Tax=Runella aurantiaca TaxID=2282308 RepID=A0A369IKH4_9BACT|nr:DUF4386 domain-containing protein [Runella aurantiaca]
MRAVILGHHSQKSKKMDTRIHQTNPKMALVAGLSLIAMALIAGFAYGYGFGNIYVANDGPATLKNLNESTTLFRWVLFSFVIILMLDVVVAWALYIFMKQVNESLSLLSAWLRLVYAALLGVALLSLVDILPEVTGQAQSVSLTMTSFRAFLAMWSLGLIVFGGHLFLLGYLMLRSGFISKILGILMLVASVCYLFANMAQLLLPNYEHYKATVDAVLSAPMALGELGLAGWLVWKGGRGS